MQVSFDLKKGRKMIGNHSTDVLPFDCIATSCGLKVVSFQSGKE